MKNALLDMLLAAEDNRHKGVRKPGTDPTQTAVSQIPAQGKHLNLPPDWAAMGTESGRCGSCARWTRTDYILEGECNAGRRAHGWFDGNPQAPVIITIAHRCAAHGGQGWQAKRSVPATR